MKIYLSDRWSSCYTCLPQTAPTAQTTQKVVAALGTGTGAPQRLLTKTWQKNKAIT